MYHKPNLGYEPRVLILETCQNPVFNTFILDPEV